MFAERGVRGATVRGIAAAAGVSAGLVRHHFGSKDGLRDSCDAYVLAALMRLKEEAVPGGGLGSPQFLAAAQPVLLIFYRYLARSMADGSPAAAAMFDHMVELGERWLAAHHPGQIADPRAYSALLVAMETGVLAAGEQLSRALGADILSPDGHLRLARAKVEFYAHPLLDPDLAAQARAAIDELAATRTAGRAAPPGGAARPRPAEPPGTRRAAEGGSGA